MAFETNPSPRWNAVFAETVAPFVKTYCVTCHGHDKPKGQLDLSADTTLAAVAKNERRWAMALERIDANEMPPEDATNASDGE